MGFATLTSKGQLTLPADIRRALDLQPGDQVEFYPDLEGNIRLRARNLKTGAMFDRFDAIFAPILDRPAPDDEAILDVMKDEDRRIRGQAGHRGKAA
jgi:antitoxin PrlF